MMDVMVDLMGQVAKTRSHRRSPKRQDMVVVSVLTTTTTKKKKKMMVLMLLMLLLLVLAVAWFRWCIEVLDVRGSSLALVQLQSFQHEVKLLSNCLGAHQHQS